MPVRAATSEDVEAWAAMRDALWPGDGLAGHRAAAATMLAGPAGHAAAFIAGDQGGRPIGFVEATLRHDHVNGCDTSPVAFMEGVYVAPAWRGAGIGRSLVAAVLGWARQRGCAELASDALIANQASHAFHLAAGFAETERVVYYRQLL